MSELSDEELRAAAAEAGISPQELRHALVERDGGALDRPGSAAASVLGPPGRGISATHAEGRVSLAPADATAAVRRSIERQVGAVGHRQGELEADVVDEKARLTYRIRSADDGTGGALVRVDVDPSASKGLATLNATAFGAIGLTMLALGALFSATMLVGGGIGLMGLAAFVVFRTLSRLGRATQSARAIASHALMEAEDAAASPRALRPGR